MSDADDADANTYGVEVAEADIEELRATGELQYSYYLSGGERVEVRLYYDDDDDDERGGGGHKVTTVLR